MKRISKTNAAYIAGFFDGEGCVGVYRLKSGCFRIAVTIAQKKPAVLYYIQRIMGIGNVYKTGKAYRFSVVNKRDVISFINLILLFSSVKRKQLELALQFLNLIGTPGIHITKKNKVRRTILAKRIKTFKKY